MDGHPHPVVGHGGQLRCEPVRLAAEQPGGRSGQNGRGVRAVQVELAVRVGGQQGEPGSAAGVEDRGGVAVAGHTVDPHNGKAVRASTGSVFHVPLARDRDAAAVLEACRAAGLTLLAADGRGELDLHDPGTAALLAGPTAWVFGGEAQGLAPELAAAADHRVRVPIHGRAESLNLATAAAVCLYASAQASRTG